MTGLRFDDRVVVVARLAIVHTAGITKHPLSIEDVAENLDTIMDVSGAQVTTSAPLAP